MSAQQGAGVYHLTDSAGSKAFYQTRSVNTPSPIKPDSTRYVATR
jgi:hypothetical protein